MIERIPTIIMVALLCQGHLFSQVIFVNGQSTAGAPDGSSWEMAFRGLEDALAIAQYGDQIWMAKGTYRPPGTNGRDSRYEIPSGVQILGGFSGSEGQVSDRDFINNIVELSGDIGIVGDPSDNCYTVVFLEDVDSTTTLDGLVIADGIATFGDVLEPFKSPRTNGGGLYIGSNLIPSLPRVRNCTFRNCSAIRSGGAVFCAALDVAGRVGPRFVDCRFEANTATERGGGLFISTGNQHDGAPLNRCVFSNNRAREGGGLGMDINMSDSIAIVNCDFTGNSVILDGTSIWIDNAGDTLAFHFISSAFLNDTSFTNGGAGVVNFVSGFGVDQLNIAVSECLFENSLYMYNDTFATLQGFHLRSRTAAELRIDRCRFIGSGLEAEAREGGQVVVSSSSVSNTKGPRRSVYIRRFDIAEFHNVSIVDNSIVGPELVHVRCRSNWINCNFSRNLLAESLFALTTETVTFINSIFWENQFRDSASTRFLDSVVIDNCLTDLTAFEDLDNDPFNPIDLFLGINNKLSSDPEFVDPDIGDYRIKSCSPAINAGDNDPITARSIQYDSKDNQRIVDVLVDIGPIEHQCPFKLEVVDILDVSCNGYDNGSLILDSCGTAPLLLFLQNSNGATSTNASNLPADTYQVFLFDGDQCSDSAIVEISEPLPLETVLEPTNIDCYGQLTGQVKTITSGGTPPYSFLWSSGSSEEELVNVGAGDYTVTVTDANGCIISSSTIVMEMPEINAQIQIVPPSSNVSSDGRIVVLSISGNPPFEVAWENGSTELSRENLIPGEYTLTVRDALDCLREYLLILEAQTVVDRRQIHIWPSPVSNQQELVVEVASPNAFDLDIRIGDVIGQYIQGFSETIEPGVHRFHYDLDLPSSVYVLYFYDGEVLFETKHLLVIEE